MATIDNTKTRDEVMVEIREIKESLAKKCDFDVAKIVAEAKERQERGHREVVGVS